MPTFLGGACRVCDGAIIMGCAWFAASASETQCRVVGSLSRDEKPFLMCLGIWGSEHTAYLIYLPERISHL